MPAKRTTRQSTGNVSTASQQPKAGKRSATRPAAAANTVRSKKKSVPTCADPEIKASRTRLYTIHNNANSQILALTNKEGFRFSLDRNDVVFVGAVDETISVTPTQMTEALDAIGGFFFVRFLKQDGTERSMYAHIMSRCGGMIKLRDLELPMAECRSCRMDRVYSLVSNGKHYVLKRAALAKLFNH